VISQSLADLAPESSGLLFDTEHKNRHLCELIAAWTRTFLAQHHDDRMVQTVRHRKAETAATGGCWPSCELAAAVKARAAATARTACR